MIRCIRRKLFTNKGETITEVLASMLIVVCALTMLAGAIVSAAKINKSADNQKYSFTNTNPGSIETQAIFSMDEIHTHIDIELTYTSEGYIYYVKKN